MLASPLLPAPTFISQHPSEDPTQYRPSRDLEAFNSLLPPPVEFIEGSSSGTLAVPEGKYEPINAPKSSLKPDRREIPPLPQSPAKAASSPNHPSTSLYTDGIDISWPISYNRGAGLHNTGNTCFLNSTLQCLLHTPPLLRILATHQNESCRVDKGFCMACNLRQVAIQSHSAKFAFSPSAITNRLQTIAKHMRKGRQEDSHEFLRYAIDALQKSCIAGFPPKLDPKIAETTWVHKVFGGRLRSRVTCKSCGHNSDTFDRILDLSLDIFKIDTLRGALRKFVAVDYLKGADKYKCEKCKKHVIAEKYFTIHEPPIVLTIHLKRFSPLGKKIVHPVDYDEHISLQPYMSNGQHGPTYSLYSIICHAGGGPNSGHYYAFVKSRDGKWWEMNDESVTTISNAPTTRKNAYMLFYLRDKGQGLESAIKASNGMALAFVPTVLRREGLVAGMKKRREMVSENDAEDRGERVSATFIGSVQPVTARGGYTADMIRQQLGTTDPQTVKIKAMIEAQAKKTLASLDTYTSGSDDDNEKVDGILDRKRIASHSGGNNNDEYGDAEFEQDAEGDTSLTRLPLASSSPKIPLVSSSFSVPITPFYAMPSSNGKKRKTPDSSDDTDFRSDARERLPIGNRKANYRANTMLRNGLNPFNRLATKKSYRKPMGI